MKKAQRYRGLIEVCQIPGGNYQARYRTNKRAKWLGYTSEYPTHGAAFQAAIDNLEAPIRLINVPAHRFVCVGRI